jgi:Tol biopolymer transport system component
MKPLPSLTAGALAISLLAACSGGSGLAPSGAPDASSATRTVMGKPTPAPTPTATPTGLTGRIAYVASGIIHIYNLATGVDTNLRVSGINPKFSPNGALITYGGVWVMNSDGTNQRQLSASGGVPSFDPTGTMIAYSDSGIWKINVDGAGRTQLTFNHDVGPAWSPDGTQIGFNAADNGGQLFLVNADGTNRHQALTSGAIIDPVWLRSPKLLFGLSGQLYSYDPLNSASLTQLTTIGGNEPSWSPDASHISWTQSTTGKKAGIWIMNADGSSPQGPVIAGGRQGSWGP